jgi:transposase-like protein
MSARRHRRHSTELKLRLVQAYLNGEGSFKSIAQQNDMCVRAD